jgi:2-phospho-L-lactate guanylyltransferase (CobY/MobA/RfbA family)
VAPTRDGGTGGLLRRPGDVIATRYGGASGLRHLRLAQQAGVSTARVDLPGFAHDVDTWADVADLRDAPVGQATAAVIASLPSRARDAG